MSSLNPASRYWRADQIEEKNILTVGIVLSVEVYSITKSEQARRERRVASARRETFCFQVW